jgi:thiamine-monophosphate kinase
MLQFSNYGGKCLVFSTDLLTEGVHFNLMYVPLRAPRL